MAVKKPLHSKRMERLFPVSQSSRRRSGANKIKSIFRGGVYVAKYSLRGAERSETPP